MVSDEEREVKTRVHRFKRYLEGTGYNRGKHTTMKKNTCDKCGSRVALRNTNDSKRGSHILLCNPCKRKERLE